MKKATSKKLFRKEARERVYDKLVVALAEFKTGIKDKKFEKNLQRTSKLFATDIAKAIAEDKVKTPKITKKKSEQKPEEQEPKLA